MTSPVDPDDELDPSTDPDLGGLGSILEQAQVMQQQLLEAQQAAAQMVVEGQAGGGVVRVEVTGGGEFRSVTIDPDAVDPDDVEMLQDLILAALHDASARLAELEQQTLQSGMSGLGGLGGLLPGGDDGPS